MRNMLLFVRGKDSANNILICSRNNGLQLENLIVGEPYRREVQSYFDDLVRAGIIAYDSSVDGRYSLFRVKGVDKLQMLSNTSNKEVDPSEYGTIEDLLILAASTNGIEYPAILGPSRYPLKTYQQVATAGAAIFMLYNPAVAVPIVGTLIAKSAYEFAMEYLADRPKANASLQR